VDLLAQVAAPIRLSQSIRATVAYADVFDFPLDRIEIHRDLIGIAASPADVGSAIDALLAAQLLVADGPFVGLPGRSGLAALRCERHDNAAQLWPLARRYGRLIGAIPFVRMVAVTGSLAAGNPDAAADLDYLIVTAPGRLWTARALTIGLVRLARRAGRRVCPNYLLSTRALALEHDDVYTAHELVQAVPITGAEIYTRLRLANRWLERWLPNRLPTIGGGEPVPRAWSAVRCTAEIALGGEIGAQAERWEGKRKRARLAGQIASAQFTPDVCEGYGGTTRQRVLQDFDRRCAALGLANQVAGAVVRWAETAEANSREIGRSGG
jgi:hypothetical protein